jgi:decaprenylphospho-beta-D-erythro-pentofuranosid-2-ulose 2-reductase
MKKIFIHGGSSEITKYLVKDFYDTYDEFHIFVRNLEKAKNSLSFYEDKIIYYVNHLDDLNQSLLGVKKLPNDINSIIWLSGDTGNTKLEFSNLDLCKKTIEINFTNVALLLNYILENKFLIKNDSFLCGFTSVAGLRGRHFNTFYGASKAAFISYLSSLRQKYNKKMLVMTIIPGYMKTNKHTLNTPSFITTSAEESAKIIHKNIKKKKEIVYVDFKWLLIMKFISLIPEKIFKKFNF